MKGEVLALDRVDDAMDLSDEDKARRQEVSAKLLLELNNRKSLLSKKVRCRWMKDGDLNMSYFHKVIKRQRNRNGLAGLSIGGKWIEDTRRVKNEVREFFAKHFQQKPSMQIELPDDFVTKWLSVEEGVKLTEPFLEEEVKSAIWDCEGSKSPGPDGFNLNFFKVCWDTIKGDLL